MEDQLGPPPPNMSKMPAKKKSCFQITSVTQAQVAAVGAADDSESLDDPDESRTEDVSSEIYDVSRAEYEPACDRSSSEEALNNVGEAEVSAVPSNAPQASQSGLVCNPVGDVRKTGVSGSSQGGQNSPTGSPLTTQPHVVSVSTSAVTSPAPAATSTVSCSSRFRVIKLDHGTGEPFRRGRWTCTEFYEKESDPLLGGRTVDGIRHPSITQDPTADRDSGLGPSVGSVVSPVTHTSPGFGSMAEVSHASSRLHSAETLPQQQALHQSYTAQQHGVGASATHTSFSSIKSTAAPAPSTVGVLQPHLAQNVLPVGQNGLPHSDVHLQKSPIIPPLYPPQQQVPLGHHMTSQSTGMMQTEYYQQQQATPVPAALSGVQPLPVSSLSAGTVGQASAPVLSLASGVASVPSQVGDVSVAPGVSVSAGQPSLAALQQQTVGILVAGSGVPQQTAGPFPAAGLPLSSGVQNVPAMAVGASVPTAVLSASSAAMPNVSTSSLPPSQMPHSITPVTRGVQGLPVIGFGQAEGAGGGRKSEGIIDAQSPVFGREMVKPFMPDTLTLNTPTVNSLFGIHIPVDGDEDRYHVSVVSVLLRSHPFLAFLLFPQ